MPLNLKSLFTLALICVCSVAFGEVTPEQQFTEMKIKAEQGDAEAQSYTGYCYYNGDGVAKDLVEAVKWYRKSAEQGNAYSQYNLGYCFFKGEGLPTNLVEGYAWCSLAIAGGYTKGKYTFQNFIKNMTQEQINAGQSRSTILYEKINDLIEKRKAEKK